MTAKDRIEHAIDEFENVARGLVKDDTDAYYHRLMSEIREAVATFLLSAVAQESLASMLEEKWRKDME